MAGAKLKAVEVAKVVQWANKVDKAKAELDEVRAHHGSVWAEFKDDPDYHKKAFKAAMVARAMDATTRAEFFRMREQYENELGLHDQLPLPLSAQVVSSLPLSMRRIGAVGGDELAGRRARLHELREGARARAGAAACR